jgi:hypothetical protein
MIEYRLYKGGEFYGVYKTLGAAKCRKTMTSKHYNYKKSSWVIIKNTFTLTSCEEVWSEHD